MNCRSILIVLFVLAAFPSSASAIRVERIRQVKEPTTVRDLFAAVFRGLGHKLGESSLQDDLEGLKNTVDRLNLELESMKVVLRDGQGKQQSFLVERSDTEYRLVIQDPIDDFQLQTVHHISQASFLWANVNGRRIHFKQELEYNRNAGFVRLDLSVINSIDRVTGLDFYFDLFEKEVGERTSINTSLAVSACVPGRPCGLIHRVARRQIACKSDQALLRLDRKVREIVRMGDGNWLELVPILARRALGE